MDPVINRCGVGRLKATGDQTNKCSEKQYKYEEKMSGCIFTLKIILCQIGGMEDALDLGSNVLCVWVQVPHLTPNLDRIARINTYAGSLYKFSLRF